MQSQWPYKRDAGGLNKESYSIMEVQIIPLVMSFEDGERGYKPRYRQPLEAENDTARKFSL